MRVIQGTKRYKLFNAKQVSGAVKKGSPIVRSRMYVKQKFTDGKWVRIRQRPWVEYRPLGGGQWRRVANKAVRPGWYRVANADVYWSPKKVTAVRTRTPEPSPPSRPTQPTRGGDDYEKAMNLIKQIWWRSTESARVLWCSDEILYVWQDMRPEIKEARIRLHPAYSALYSFIYDECKGPAYDGDPST